MNVVRTILVVAALGIGLVACLDGFEIAHRSAGLQDRTDSLADADVRSVAKREKRI